jgi:beta-glucosidase
MLRGEWGFTGFVISDCDTIGAISTSFHYTANVEEATAMAVKAGGDINCGPEYSQLLNATAHGFISEAELDVSVRRIMRRRMQTGDLDALGQDGKAQTPYAKIPTHQIDTPEHKGVAHRIVRESVVLLTNGHAMPKRQPKEVAAAASAAAVLPLDSAELKSVLVVGPTSDDITVQAHTYHGTPSRWITVLGGIRQTLAKIAPTVNVTYMEGCDRTSTGPTAKQDFAETIAAVSEVDAVIFVGGLEASMEEEGTDRVSDIGHPGVQLDLIQALHTAAAGKPLVVVTVSGGPVAEPFLVDPSTQHTAWLWLSYFGQDGSGVAEIIFGQYAPSGRTPFSVAMSAAQLGDGLIDYSMTGGYGRTYRYNRYENASAAPMFPFAYGLGYGNVSMTLTVLSPTGLKAKMHDQIVVSVSLARHDTLALGQDHVVALFGAFLTANETASPVTAMPVRQLLAFEKVTVPAAANAAAAASGGGGGGVSSVQLVVNISSVPAVDRQPWPGVLKLWVGDGGGYGGEPAPQRRLAAAAESATVQLTF